MPKCKFNPKLRCADPNECWGCAEFKKTGQSMLIKEYRAIEDEEDAIKLGLKKPTAVTTKFEAIGYDKEYACPFCLGIAALQKYLISTKKGYHQGLGLCPDCKNKMQFKSLLADWTAEQYAEWVFAYIADGFWQKCKWSQWKERLAKMGWATQFWNRYKALKGEVETETYEQVLNRQAKEEYERAHGEEE